VSFSSWYNRTLNKVWGFVEDRTAMKKWALRPQPEFTFKPSYWTGSFVAVALSYQIISGALLLLYYQPSTNSTLTACGQAAGTLSASPAAWCSTYYIVNSVPMGQLLLSSHLYGAYAMIFLMFVHFFRGYYVGVYKSPREFSWMVGTLLMVVTMGMGFTGYLLPYTQISYNATNVGVVLALRLPTVGPLLGPFILADGTSQGLLSRMFDAHVIPFRSPSPASSTPISLSSSRTGSRRRRPPTRSSGVASRRRRRRSTSRSSRTSSSTRSSGGSSTSGSSSASPPSGPGTCRPTSATRRPRRW
jgi:hypothetical protein